MENEYTCKESERGVRKVCAVRSQNSLWLLPYMVTVVYSYAVWWNNCIKKIM
jgi:hypothetical protein